MIDDEQVWTFAFINRMQSSKFFGLLQKKVALVRVGVDDFLAGASSSSRKATSYANYALQSDPC
jgi:hypothetical protein